LKHIITLYSNFSTSYNVLNMSSINIFLLNYKDTTLCMWYNICILKLTIWFYIMNIKFSPCFVLYSFLTFYQVKAENET